MRVAGAFVSLVVGLVVALLLGDAALRLGLIPLPDDLNTHLFECYNPDDPSSKATFPVPRLGTDLPKAGFDCGCAWGGYRWRHRTDAYGGRNPETWETPDVVLLGDSIVYGHGVEESDTFAHRLRDLLHRTVVNQAYMGQCPVQYLAIMRNLVLPRRPRVVVMVMFQNDLTDVYSYRSVEEMDRFIATGEASEARTMLADEVFASDRGPRGWRAWTWGWLRHRWLIPRVLGFYARRWSATHRFSVPEEPDAPANVEPEGTGPDPSEVRAIAYTRRATALMAQWASDAGTTLVLAYIPGLAPFTHHRDHVISRATREIAEQLDLPFIDLTPALSARDGVPVPGIQLPRDGHLTPLGHERVARALADFLTARHLLDR